VARAGAGPLQRIKVSPRPDWRKRAEAIGFRFHTIDGAPYWTEDAAYLFTAQEIDQIEAATQELEQMCLQVVDRVVREGRYDLLALPDAAAELIQESWVRFDKNLYGRFDLACRPGEKPKLLEYNADTPTALFEASVVQWEWLETTEPSADQFNSIHEKLIEAWRNFGLPFRTLHFTCVRDNDEDRGTVDYLRDTAVQGGIDAEFLFIDEIGWNGEHFVDLNGREIQGLFKLYPWEWMMREEFARHIGPGGLQVIEPAWKMVLSNKALLPLLWGMFEGHDNLLPAAFSPEHLDGPLVRKPIYGREGANVSILDRGGQRAAVAETEGDYGAEGFVYQAYAPLPVFDGNHAVVGSWVVASQAAGIGMREDDGPITRNTSRFVPHLFR
jgi:glutathionylspermidine synthase